jgi:hypothetical protein
VGPLLNTFNAVEDRIFRLEKVARGKDWVEHHYSKPTAISSANDREMKEQWDYVLSIFLSVKARATCSLD